jgi:SnoaL-like domain
LAVGTGWLAEEVEACGADFATRGRRADEQVKVMRLLWEVRPDDVVRLFTEAAELRLPDPPRSLEPVRISHGRDGVRAALSALDGVLRTEHAIVGEVYAEGADPGYALGRITASAHHWSVDGGQATDVVWHLRYDDEYEHTPSGWRILGRSLTINAIETRPTRVVRQRLPSSRPDQRPR